MPLAAVYGIVLSENQVFKQGVPGEVDISTLEIVGLNIAVGAVVGVILLYVMSFPLTWVARFQGGIARASEVRTVLAWASVPYIPLLVAFIILALVSPRELLVRNGVSPYEAVGDTPWIIPVVLYSAIWGIASVWHLVIGIAGFSEINRFGVGKAMISFIVVIALGAALMVGVIVALVRVGEWLG